MTSYIARTGGQKKKNILRQKELELRGEIRRNGSATKITRRAEKVRAAQLGVIKVLNKEADLTGAEREVAATKLQRLEDARAHWETVSVDEIIEFYSGEPDDSVELDRKKYWDFRPR